MLVENLGIHDQARTGFTHKFTIQLADVVALGAATSGAIALAPYVAGYGCIGAAYKLVTAFDGGATSALKLDVGHNGATTDDPDSILDNYEIHADGTEVFYGDANGAAFATLRTGYFPLDAGNYEATFTATGANFDVLTQGEVIVFLALVDLNKI
jgi:hypothetical protein